MDSQGSVFNHMKHHEIIETKILSRTSLGEDSFLVTLEKKTHFTPGQVLGVTGDLKDPLWYYSICSSSLAAEWEILFKLVPEGKVTNFLARSPVGSTVYVSHPQGTFIQRPGPGIWIAGGTGVAPFLSMVRTGIRHPLIQGGRTLESLYFHEYFQEKLGKDYHPCCSTQAAPGVPKIRLMDFLKTLEWKTEENHYLCGSATMVVEVRDLLISRGVPYEQIYSEIYF